MSVPRQDLQAAAPFRPRRSGARWARAGTSCAARRTCSATRSSRPSRSSRWAPRSSATLPYAEQILDTTRLDSATTYALLLTAVAVGSVVGGLAVGAIGERVAKGPIIIAGFVGMGLSLVAAGLISDPFVAIGLFSFVGLFNMLFIIPTITLFQQRTPQRLMGRVVSSRQALVFGAIALSMGLSGWLAELVGADVVLVLAGGICALAGASGLLIPAMRNAR